MTTHQHTPLEAEIRSRIARSGPIPVAEFMAMCLYDPNHGYYNHGSPIGAAGDFITAPEISQMFGELIGLWVADVWQSMGKPEPVALIEFGPGRGTMMGDALRAARAAPGFHSAVCVHLIETSADLQSQQRTTLSSVDDGPWHGHHGIEEVPPAPSIIVANEFFDALPIRQAERRPTGWHERMVAVDASGALTLTIARNPLCNLGPKLPSAAVRAGIGGIFEGRAQECAAAVARRAALGGAALIIDYGHIKSATGDTLQAVRSHRYASPLALPGMTDLTAHVDFEALGAAARDAGARGHGPSEQRTLLKRVGIEARAAAVRPNPTEQTRTDMAGPLRRFPGAGRDKMGSLFKAIASAAPAIPCLPGFAP